MPKPIKKEILKALEAYQQRVADILTKQGVKAHVVGDLKAYKKLAPIRIDFSSVQKGAKEFGLQYGDLLRKEGATMIHGKKVAWLADSIKETRGKVASIINEGVRTGKGTDAIARELRGTLIRDKNYEYKRIARTETGNIQALAADKRYNEEGVEEVDWLCGQKPCAICAQYCGKRYKISEAPDLLVHPNCTCDKAPVVTRKVRAKIDKKRAEIEKPLTKKDELVQLKRDERATANELWKKTHKDGKEHAKIRNGGMKYYTGDKHSFKYRPPREEYRCHHTHPNWDCPLSGVDIGGFLKNFRNMTETASSPKRIYMAIRTEKTISIQEDYMKEVIARFQRTSVSIDQKAVLGFTKKTGKTPTEAQAQEIWREALNETNKMFAKEFKYDYISFLRK